MTVRPCDRLRHKGSIVCPIVRSINHRDRMVLFFQNLSHRNNARKQLLTSLINIAKNFSTVRDDARVKSIGRNSILPFSRALYAERASLRLNRRGPR